MGHGNCTTRKKDQAKSVLQFVCLGHHTKTSEFIQCWRLCKERGKRRESVVGRSVQFRVSTHPTKIWNFGTDPENPRKIMEFVCSPVICDKHSAQVETARGSEILVMAIWFTPATWNNRISGSVLSWLGWESPLWGPDGSGFCSFAIAKQGNGSFEFLLESLNAESGVTYESHPTIHNGCRWTSLPPKVHWSVDDHAASALTGALVAWKVELPEFLNEVVFEFSAVDCQEGQNRCCW